MNIIELLLPMSIMLGTGFVVAFVAAVRSGQFDDVETPAQRALFEAPKANRDTEKTETKKSVEKINTATNSSLGEST